MADITTRLTADLCHEACRILAEHPEGMHYRELFEAVARRQPIPATLLQDNPKTPGEPRYYNVIGWNTTDEVKAGWLTKDGWGRWRLTEAGRDGLDRYPTSQEFHAAAHQLYLDWKRGEDEIKANVDSDSRLRQWPLEDPSRLLSVKASDRLSAGQRALFDLTADHAGEIVTTTDIGRELGGLTRHQVVGRLRGLTKILRETAGTEYWPFRFVKGSHGEQGYVMDPRIAAIWLDRAQSSPAQDDQPSLRPPSREELAAHLNTSADEITEIEEILEDKRQVIFEGPPGSGKTYAANAFARYYTGGRLDGPRDEHVVIVQFHQSYGYEDFIQGIRPQPKDGHISYEPRNGVFKDLCEEAARRPNERFVILIDEINRGNISRIFGELLLLLEYRDETVRLPYEDSPGRLFSIPRNVHVIGTMNTADRSLAQIDYALRRRFYFYRFSPVVDGRAPYLESWLAQNQVLEPARSRILDLFLALNKRVEQELGQDFLIGHSYFMNPSIADREGRDRIWRRAILPLLEEYFYNRPNRRELLDGFALDRLMPSWTGPSEDGANA